MEWLHSKKSFRPDMMKEEPAAALINETYRVLDSAVKSKLKKSVPQELTDHLERDTYYFSGFKTFHELREASALLKGDDGGFKPFDKFLKDVEKIDNTYNKSYLYAEYNFAVQSTQMAVKWKEWEKDGDDYDLQFRTSEDDRVRPEHAALDGTTLPFSDEFWNKYIPPLGWNCRCTTVQVLKGKYPRAESWRAQQLGEAATSGTGEKIFRFNPGKQETVFPPKHPYLPKNTQCAGCDRNRRSTLNYNPASESCQTCNAIATCLNKFGTKESVNARRKDITAKVKEQIVGQSLRNDGLGHDVVVTGKSAKEFLNQPHKHYNEKNELLLDIKEAFRNATYLGHYDGYNHPRLITSHIFEIELAGDKSWLIVREYDSKEFVLYSCSDSDKISTGLKK